MKRHTYRFTLYTFILGWIFPLVSTIILTRSEHLHNMSEVWSSEHTPLLIMIYMAPFVLALVAYLIGQYQERLISKTVSQSKIIKRQENESLSQKQDLLNLKAAIDSFAMVCSFDYNGDIFDANPNFCQKYKLPLEKIKDVNIKQIFNSNKTLNKIFSSLEQGQIFQDDLLIESDLSSDQWQQVVMVPYKDNFLDEHYKFISIAMDITQKKVEQMKSTHNAQITILGEMAAGIAHEINNPLTIVKSYAKQVSMALNHDDIQYENKDKTLEYLVKIDNSVNLIGKIIRGLKVFSRDAQNDPFEQNSIKQIIDDALSLSQTRIEKKGIHFTISDFNPHLTISCRSIQISQVIVNLLNNARDAVESLSEKWIDLSIKESEDHKRIQFIVTDSGNGIAPEVAQKVLQPFFTTKQEGKGTGLGLSLSSQIIKGHQGTLSLNQDSDHTQFIIDLPVKHDQSL